MSELIVPLFLSLRIKRKITTKYEYIRDFRGVVLIIMSFSSVNIKRMTCRFIKLTNPKRNTDCFRANLVGPRAKNRNLSKCGQKQQTA